MEPVTDDQASVESNPMASGDAQTASATLTAANRGRMTLLLIAGIPVIVILASTWMWYYVVSGNLDVAGALGTSNRGELVQPPRQAMDAGLVSKAGVPLAAAVPPRWTIVVPQRGARCDALCERRLYETRQIHMALGKELGRVQRMFVTDAQLADVSLAVERLSDERPLPANFETYLASEQRGLSAWQLPPDAFASLFSEYLEQADSWYLMDPAGWVMMRYDDTVSYKDVISDFKFLIKNSNG